MNERLKELAEQAGLMCTEDVNADGLVLWFKKFDLERFAELVRADEREACAALCLEPIRYGQVQNNQSTVGGHKYVRDKTAQECAYLIRARGEK